MAGLGYTWTADVTITGGYSGQNKGAIPLTTTPQTGEVSGSHEADYFYSDSNAQNPDGSWGNNANSSQVHYTIRDDWTASVDDNNIVTLQVTTTVVKIERKDISGNPNLTVTNGRDIILSRTRNGTPLWNQNNNPINQSRILATNINLGTETIVLPPGGGTRIASVWIRNHTTGTGWDDPVYTDYIEAGVSFQNNLPADYRPGSTWNGVNWMSHNRSAGAANLYNGSGWNTMRTEDGGTGTGNPPSISHSSTMYNQRKTGQGG